MSEMPLAAQVVETLLASSTRAALYHESITSNLIQEMLVAFPTLGVVGNVHRSATWAAALCLLVEQAGGRFATETRMAEDEIASAFAGPTNELDDALKHLLLRAGALHPKAARELLQALDKGR